MFRCVQLNRREEPIYPDTEPVRWCCVHAGRRQLSFEIMQSRQSVFSSMSSSLRAYLWPCAAQRWENRCDLPVNKEGDSGNQAGVIRYAGTRAWLEDESLSITLSKTVCCCIPVTIGHKAEELQGVLDSGQIETTIDVAENMNAITCISQLCYPLPKQPFQVSGTINSSSFVEGDNLPRFRQAGNADPTGAGLLSAGESHTLLVVKVILAKGLSIPSREDFKEHLNPTVSVHWNGMQKSTREVHNSADPFWDQEVHFKLMDRDNPRKKAPKKYEDFSQTARDSRVELMVWDKEGLASRTALGKCHVDFYDIYFQRKAYGIITATSNGRKVERLVYRSGPMPLETPFATDGAERKKNAGDRSAAASSKKDDFSTRYIEFLCYFDRTDTNPVPLLKKGREGRDAAAIQQQDYKHIDEPLSAAAIKSGRAFWDLALKDVKDRAKRFFPFYGIDELSGTYHFLPTFLKRVNPPAEIHSIGALMYFISAIEFTKKPPPWIDPLKDATPAAQQGDIWQWADPFFFLERRKGDTKDHAITLCNWLLGLGLDAYVCIGTVRPKKGAAPRATAEPHFWVMTREEDDAAPPSDSAASAASSPPGGASVSSGPSYFIRFWEAGTGRTYRVKGIVTEAPANLKPKRYLEEPDIKPPPMDEEEFRRQREKQAEMAKQRALGLGLDGDDEQKQDAEHADADAHTAGGEDEVDGQLPAAASAASKKSAPAPRVIDGAMRARLSAAELQSIELENRAVALDASLDDPDENVSDLDLLQLTSNLAREEARLRSGPDAHAKAKELLDEKSDMESVRSVFDEKKLALVAQERAVRLHQQKLVADLEDPTLKQQKKQLGRQCPYASIDLVFNHKHLYANLGVSDPELAFFDFERHPERWCEFQETQYRQYLGIQHLKTFYPDRGLAAVKAPQRDAEELEDALITQLKQTIATHRKYPADNVRPSMDTEFLQRFEWQAEEQAAQGQGNNPKHTAQAYLMVSTHTATHTWLRPRACPALISHLLCVLCAMCTQQRLEHEQLVALHPKELRSLQKRLKESTPHVDYDYVDRGQTQHGQHTGTHERHSEAGACVVSRSSCACAVCVVCVQCGARRSSTICLRVMSTERESADTRTTHSQHGGNTGDDWLRLV